MFSIIIPTYNRVSELTDVLDSLLKQTKLISEILIVDDSDGNEIEQLIEDMQSKFIKKNMDLKYIRNLREKSLTIARNIGIKNAIGEIVLFLDDDVVLDVNYLSEILSVYNNNPDALGVQGFITNLRANENPIVSSLKTLINKLFYFSSTYDNHCRALPSTNTVYPLYLEGVTTCEWLTGANQSYRRTIFEEFTFDEKLKRYSFKEDVDISYRIQKKYPNSLFITPYAELIHKVSPSGRLPKKDLIFMKHTYSLYLFYKNIDQSYTNKIIYLWSEFGHFIRNICAFVVKPSSPTFLRLRYLISATITNVKHINEIKNGNIDFLNKMLGYKL